MRWLRTHKAVTALALLAALLLIPIKSNVVPAWNLRVLRPDGTPAAGMPVVLAWRDYSVNLSGSEVRTITDSDGYVHFGAMDVWAPVLQRALVSMGNIGIHASHGPSGQIVVFGTREYETASIWYSPERPFAFYGCAGSGDLGAPSGPDTSVDQQIRLELADSSNAAAN
jgi:hypothetical protein